MTHITESDKERRVNLAGDLAHIELWPAQQVRRACLDDEREPDDDQNRGVPASMSAVAKKLARPRSIIPKSMSVLYAAASSATDAANPTRLTHGLRAGALVAAFFRRQQVDQLVTADGRRVERRNHHEYEA